MPGYSFSNLEQSREARLATPFLSFPSAMSLRIPKSGRAKLSSLSMWILRSLASFSAMLPVFPERCCTSTRSCQISSCSFSIDGGADNGIGDLRNRFLLIDTVHFETQTKLSLDDYATGHHVANPLLFRVDRNQYESYQV